MIEDLRRVLQSAARLMDKASDHYDAVAEAQRESRAMMERMQREAPGGILGGIGAIPRGVPLARPPDFRAEGGLMEVMRSFLDSGPPMDRGELLAIARMFANRANARVVEDGDVH